MGLTLTARKGVRRMDRKPGMYADWQEAARRLWKPALVSVVLWLLICAACYGAAVLASNLSAK